MRVAITPIALCALLALLLSGCGETRLAGGHAGSKRSTPTPGTRTKPAPTPRTTVVATPMPRPHAGGVGAIPATAIAQASATVTPADLATATPASTTLATPASTTVAMTVTAVPAGAVTATATVRPADLAPPATTVPMTGTPAPGSVGKPVRPALPPPATPTLKPRPPVAPVPAKATPRGPLSWMEGRPLLTFYGRAFGIAPILGRLGFDQNFAQFAWNMQPFAHGVKDADGGTDPRIVIHLIYAMATGCDSGGNCLSYLDDTGVDIVKDYIKPAAAHGWLVVLDDQLGRSDPATEVMHIKDKGYLKYDNVEVALDPEFRAAPGQVTPGIPVGTVTAAELNAAQSILNTFGVNHHLLHRKIMMVHQFQWGMIQNRGELRDDFPYVTPVVIADGFGAPGLKAHVYDELFGPGSSGGVARHGIKLFYPNPYEGAGHGDYPVMTWRQVFGLDPCIDTNGKAYYVRPRPSVIVVA